jgi:3',5'-cyclic AMP phosphodiesterase CpdA
MIVSLLRRYGLHCACAIVLTITLAGCGAVESTPLPNENIAPPPEGFSFVARLAHLSDPQIVDEESPGRLTPTYGLVYSAWRPQERFSIHLLDGMIRAVNLYHDRIAPIDFLLLTGDAIDNAQTNELDWLLATFDGREVNPLSGVDDRPADVPRGGPEDPHTPFVPEGLYRQGIHGPGPSIPWYAVMGNHDRYAVGTFPIVVRPDGGRVAPLPLLNRVGLFLPQALAPDGRIAHGPITPAHPGPPSTLTLPLLVPANPARRFVLPDEYVAAHFATVTGPPGHGFSQDSRPWYSATPVPGLRLIVLDTSQAAFTVPTGVYDSGAIVAEQLAFLIDELNAAIAADELAILATHHQSGALTLLLGTAIGGPQLRELLSGYPNLVLHLCGHSHVPAAWDRGGYVEIETASSLDAPQEGRIIEIWRRGDEVAVRYASFNHLYEGAAFRDLPESDRPEDPFLPMRRYAFSLAAGVEAPSGD